MARTKKRIFDGLYAQLEETDGNVVLFSAKGEPSVIFEITNPVQQLCTDATDSEANVSVYSTSWGTLIAVVSPITVIGSSKTDTGISNVEFPSVFTGRYLSPSTII